MRHKHFRHTLRKTTLGLVIPIAMTVSFDPSIVSATNLIQNTITTTARSTDSIAIATANNYVNVRKAASTSSEIVGKLYRGNAATVISKSGSWAKVKSGTVEGYVHTDYLAIGKAAEALYDTYGTKKATVIADTLRVRKSTSTSSEIIGRIKKGSTHNVYAEKNGWLQIKYNGANGWISKEYTRVDYTFSYATPVGNIGSSSSNVATNKVTGKQVAEYAKKFVGNPYLYGGTSLTSGADCSGFVQSVFKNFKISVPRTSRSQATAGTKVATSAIKEGDLVFFATNGVVDHVGIYIGNGKMVHASNPKDGIKISNYNYRTIYTVRRIIN